MSYLVMARKWRPNNFDEVIGQEHITDTLKKAIETGRIAHSFLFSGIRGVGKTTVARILAKSLNCEKGPTTTPCDACSLCKEIKNGNCIDVLEIDGASNRGIDEIREIRENIIYSSMKSKYKIYIIDEVHMLTKEAFNALLKTLEEPPPHVIFIFATTEPHKIPETIISRCQRYDFKRISAARIGKRLEYICQQESINIEPDALSLICQQADGSARDAQSLLDQIHSSTNAKITQKDVSYILGLTPLSDYFQLTQMIIDRDLKGGISLIRKILDQGYDIMQFLLGFQSHLRNLLMLTIDKECQEIIEVSEENKIKYLDQAGHFVNKDILRMIKLVNDLINQIKWGSQPEIMLEIGMVKLIMMDSSILLEELLKKYGKEPIPTEPTQPRFQPSIASIPPTVSGKKEETRESGESSETTSSVEEKKENNEIKADDSSLNLTTIKKQWPKITETIINNRPALGSFLRLGKIHSFKNNTIVIHFPFEGEFQAEQIKKRGNKDLIEREIYNIIKHKIYISVEISNNVQLEGTKESGIASPLEKTNKDNMQKPINEAIKQEPIIDSVIKTFDGEIL